MATSSNPGETYTLQGWGSLQELLQGRRFQGCCVRNLRIITNPTSDYVDNEECEYVWNHFFDSANFFFPHIRSLEIYFDQSDFDGCGGLRYRCIADLNPLSKITKNWPQLERLHFSWFRDPDSLHNLLDDLHRQGNVGVPKEIELRWKSVVNHETLFFVRNNFPHTRITIDRSCLVL
jgi:hypothetical protein